MKPGKLAAGATLLLASIAFASAIRAQAQDTVLTTEPLNFTELIQSGTDAAPKTGRAVLTTRVSPNINNEKLRDAIKKLIGKEDVTYEVDADVPDDKRVTLKAENIPLATAINVLTESAGIGCTQSTKRTVTDADKTSVTISKVNLHFRKSPSAPLGQGLSSFVFDAPYVFDRGALTGTGKEFTVPNIINKSVDRQSPLSKIFVSPDGTNNYITKLFDGTSKVQSNRPFIYDLNSSEERSTFTCPHCKQQVTVIKKRVAVKCPTCGRTFQDDWKFCPVDGAKRPDDSSDWKFCPHCGKSVS